MKIKQLRRQHCDDGVGRLKFDFHTGMEEYEPWGSDYYVIRDDFHTYEDTDGALGRKALAAGATAVLAGLAF